MFPAYLTRLEASPEMASEGDANIPAELEAEMLEELERRWREDLPDIRLKLAQTDTRMKKEYAQRHLLRTM